MLRFLLKTKENGIASKGVEKMMAMMGIKSLMWRLLKEGKRFLYKMERLRNLDPDRGTERGTN